MTTERNSIELRDYRNDREWQKERENDNLTGKNGNNSGELKDGH